MVPAASAIRYDSALSMPLPNWESATTSMQVMMETVSVFGSANPGSPGAPPRNSLSVKPVSYTHLDGYKRQVRIFR